MHYYVLFKLLVNTKKTFHSWRFMGRQQQVCNAHEMQGI